MRRLKIDRYTHADIELVADANEPRRYTAIDHEKLYDYGLAFMFGEWTANGWRRPGNGASYDIEGRGGAWVRRIEPAPWMEPDFDEDDDA